MPVAQTRVIILNGPSSSGKSSIAESLQQQSSNEFIHFPMDDFLNDYYAAQASGSPADTDDPAKVVREMAISAGTLLEAGRGLVVDCVAFPKAMEIWLDVLGKNNPLLVSVTAPLDILEAREQERGDREPGTARRQYDRLHAGISYDLEIDTSVTSSEAAAAKIISELTAPSHRPAPATPPAFSP